MPTVPERIKERQERRATRDDFGESLRGRQGVQLRQSRDRSKLGSVRHGPLGSDSEAPFGYPRIFSINRYKDATQSIGDSAFETVTFPNVAFNVDRQGFPPVYSAGVWTIPPRLGGLWRVTAHIDWAANATGRRELRIYYNNTTSLFNHTRVATSATSMGMPAVWEYQLAENDFIELQAWQNSGAALNISAAQAGNHMTLTYVGKA